MMGIIAPYVLASGGASTRKNLASLAEAWPLIHSSRPDLTLILSGPEHPQRKSLFVGLANVRMVGRVDSDLVPGLMASASAVVVPSLYEGFGLPALEGMAVGTPVVAANTSSLPEGVGDRGILVGSASDEIAEGVLSAVSGDSAVESVVHQGRARAKEFTWERSVAAHADVWRKVSTLVG